MFSCGLSDIALGLTSLTMIAGGAMETILMMIAGALNTAAPALDAICPVIGEI